MNTSRLTTLSVASLALLFVSGNAAAEDGVVTWTTVGTTHSYSYSEDLDDLTSVIDGATSYCSVEVSSASGLTGNGVCGSPTTNLGFQLSATFPVCADGEYEFRLGPDYGRGGALFLDGVELDSAEDDLWWAGSWGATSEILTGADDLGVDYHTVDAIGFEGCCDGAQALQVRIDGGSWKTASPSALGCDYCADDGGLGAAADYNVFVLGEFDGWNSDIQGRTAVGGDASFANYGIGSRVSGGTTVSVAGHLTVSSSQIYGGDGEASSCTTSSVGVPSGTLDCAATDPFDASDHGGEMRVLSGSLADLAANGTTTTTRWGGVYLSGSDPALNVFELDLDSLGFASWVWNGWINTFSISAPSGSTVVINVVGDTSPLFRNGGISTSGAGAKDIVWNFSEGGDLKIRNVSVPGAILAPRTDLDFSNGNINGTVIVSSMTGTGEFHEVAFDGTLCE